MKKMMESSFKLFFLVCLLDLVFSMTNEEKEELRNEAKDMFYHAYFAYMDNAFPADELMPISCRGRYRGREINRGDIDDALGNFSLTLIDSLDTLIIMGDVEEFESAVKLVIDHVTFDHDISVSVFETNIRVVGGLISGHLFSEMIKNQKSGMNWYAGELLDMAKDVATRLLPAFNSTTGLPHPRVNLRYGIKLGKIRTIGETCTACAGTMILEFGALSRLTGDQIFEDKASMAMDVLWSSRHRMSNLVGNVVNINTGDWVRRDSGVGAGIDSYYEYVAKAYVLLGQDKYLSRWEIHYRSIMKYLASESAPGLLQDVHMHRPGSISKHFFDALGAFWPGLQVLMGDLKPAIESHEVLYQVMQRHNFIPEAFTTDFQVHWGQHLLRPEFLESTYMLYKATNDDYYLEAGKKVLKSLQKHTRVTCGYTTIRDVRTLQKEDRMDSFVLAETFKYLYLLFARDEDMIISLDDFVFTTEGHLLPLTLAKLSNKTKNNLHQLPELFSQTCPTNKYIIPQEIRLSYANVVNEKCPIKEASSISRKLTATEFQSKDPEHLKLVKEMGITLISLPDGRVQLLHTSSNAKSPEDAQEGLLFMQEMIDLSKEQQLQNENQQLHIERLPPQAVVFNHHQTKNQIIINAGPAHFGKQLTNDFKLSGNLIKSDPIRGCGHLENAKDLWGKIVIIERGDCMFIEKARLIQSVGAKGGIVIDNHEGTSSADSPLFAMSGDGTDDVSIPMVFLFWKDGKQLLDALKENNDLMVTLKELKVNNLKDETIKSHNVEHKKMDFTTPVSSFLQHTRRNGGTTNYQNLDDFLNPSNNAVRKLVEMKVLKNPQVLNELTKVDFSEVLKLFERLLKVHGSIEGAYSSLFLSIEEETINPKISKDDESTVKFLMNKFNGKDEL